jgi:single-strand DNA-binding protein
MIGNHVSLIGRVTRDIELRHTPSGKAVCDVGLAMNNHRNGDQEEVVFMDVTFWDRAAEIIAQHVQKGHLLAVTGRIVQRERVVHKGTDKERTEKKTSVMGEEFKLLPNGPRPDAAARPEPRGGKHDPAPVPGARESAPPLEDQDEIPF